MVEKSGVERSGVENFRDVLQPNVDLKSVVYNQEWLQIKSRLLWVKETKRTQRLPLFQIHQRLRKSAARGKHICESKNRRQDLNVKTYTVHLRHQKKPKEHENYRLS